MSLRTAFDRMVNANEVPNCTIARIRASLDGDDVEFLDRLEQRVTPTEIARTLREDGHSISDSTARRHYRRDCECTRAGVSL